ncbi:hypothetical protein IE4872_CH03276 [Rhizobium gallicum]|uniref:Uncharacterized protein n=1 Tax=Rhizobium gallicum TaxID=56730 RepID=A0A1L5NLU1_9HYPH|nr:hypothetical protein [Rhizobium gallicum]APO68876.1 hypothetical protein IE4872_CH03276 [Rhizobium gallicum]
MPARLWARMDEEALIRMVPCIMGAGGLRPGRIGWPQMDVSPIGRIEDHSRFYAAF